MRFSQLSKFIILDFLKSGRQMPPVRGIDILPGSPRILLIAPYENKELKIGSYLSPPLGIYRSVNYLRLFGMDVEIFDPNLNGADRLEKYVKDNRFDLIGFSTYEPTLKNDLSLAKLIKEISPNSLFIVGGEAAFYNKEKLLGPENPFDILYAGFAEFSLLDTVIDYMSVGKDLINHSELIEKIPGTVSRSNSDEFIINTRPLEKLSADDFKVINNLFDTSIVPYENYWKHMESLYSGQQITEDEFGRIRTARVITVVIVLLVVLFAHRLIFWMMLLEQNVNLY